MKFAKLQALGNDFLVFDRDDNTLDSELSSLAVEMCDRHYGAGADGVVVVERAPEAADAEVSTRIFNADGSEAEVSGNGTRCVAAYLDATGRWPAGPDPIRIATVAGIKRVRRVGPLLEMEMGTPRLSSADVPMTTSEPLERVVGVPLTVGGVRFEVTATSIGNPHCALFVERVRDVDLATIGPQIERHQAFPNRVNVEFIEVVARDRIRVRFWERGAGPTLSSGTGSSAALVASVLNGRTDRDVMVETPAGELRVRWREDDVVVLSGPATLVYSGVWGAPPIR